MNGIRIYRSLIQPLFLLVVVSWMMSVSCTTSDQQEINSQALFRHSSSDELTVGGYGAEYDLLLSSLPGTAYTITIEQSDPTWCWTSRLNLATEKKGIMTLDQRVEKIYVGENFGDKPRTATIRISFGDGTSVELLLTQRIFDRPALYDKPWPELPAYSDEKTRLTVTHYAEIRSGEKLRNFTLCYDTELGYSVWCAYPLHKCYMSGTYNRTDDWQYDPKIPTQYQANLTLGSYRNSWVRGHQVMSYHRYTAYSDELNAQTFYSTNIMPQHYGFNGGLWNDVESVCTKQVCADTLYCVTGAWGKQGTTTDKAGKEIAVPAYCFKAMIRTRSGKTGKRITEITDPTELKGIAYWAPNNSDGNVGNLSDFMISIAELEELTGFTFFPQLNDAVAEEVKAQVSPSDWGIR